VAFDEENNQTYFLSIPKYGYVTNIFLSIDAIDLVGIFNFSKHYSNTQMYLPLNSSTPIDYAQHGLGITLVNNPTRIDTGGRFGRGSFEFNKTNHLIVDDGSSNAWAIIENGTYNIWIRPTDITNNKFGLISPDTHRVSLHFNDGTIASNNGDNITFAIFDTEASWNIITKKLSDYASSDEWIMITATWRARESMDLYINGQRVDNKTLTNKAVYAAIGNVEVGDSALINQGMDGRISDTLIMNKTLNASEIESLYYTNASMNIYFINRNYDIFNSNVSFNISDFNSILENDCNCQNCSLDGYLCNIPMAFYSNITSTYSLNLTVGNYSFGIDNCSNSFYIPSNSTLLNLTTIDQKTNTKFTTNTSFLFYYNFYGNSSPKNYYLVNMQKDDYKFCKYPSWSDFQGDMAHTITAAGYEQLVFNRYNTLYNGTFKAYLLETEATSNFITYNIVDATLEEVANALVTIYRNIGAEDIIVYQGLSDVAGQIVVYQDQLYKYHYIINASGFPIKEFDLQPVLTSYNVKLTEGDINIFTNEYQGIRYKLFPDTTLFGISNEYQNLSFALEGSNLEYFGLEIDGLTNCYPQCRILNYNDTGGNIIIGLNISEPQRFYASLFFKKVDGNEITINNYPYDGIHWNNTEKSISNFITDLNTGTSQNQRAVIAAFIMVIVAVLVASFGGDTIALLWAELITVLTLSIPNKTYSVGTEIIVINGIGLIGVFWGLLISTFFVINIIWLGSKQ
jgi:hypothetical protein